MSCRNPFALSLALAALTMVVPTSDLNAQAFPFVIPGDDATPSVVDRSGLIDAPVGKEFVRVRDAHFAVGDKRIRFWGVNLCFGANFPTHDQADRLAPHFAKLGINAVRFHHMDMQDAPGGIWGGVDDNGIRQFAPEMVDRLDYFLAKLHENGIYANLNLHVSRTLTTAEGFPEAEGVPWWAASNKWVMYYDRDVQSEVKRYCRMLLGHRNPYRRNLPRANDPGIALVEMLNENYFSRQGYALYRQMPRRFQASLVARWNEWLLARYQNQSRMSKTWSNRQPPMGDELVGRHAWSDSLNSQTAAGVWSINRPKEGLSVRWVTGPAEVATGAIRFEPRITTEQDFEQQLTVTGLTTNAKQPLSLTYWVRSERPRSYRVELSSSEGGQWRELGLFETLQSKPTWSKVTRVVFPDESVKDQVNLAFTFGNDTTPIEFAGATLQMGAVAAPLPRNQSLADRTIGIPESGWPIGAHQDMKRFMIQTEREWVAELKTFLREEIGVKVPITASQVNYHDPSVNSDLNDFVDLHNYWHHPIFPSDANWSADRWTVGNEPMEAHPTRSSWPTNSLISRMGWRYQGKPMTMSEWNYPEPSPYGASCVPMAAALCALQDWDAVFFFQYDQGNDDYFRNRASDFFSFNGQPVKLAALSQFSNLFLRGDLPPLRDSITSPIDRPVDGMHALRYRIGVGKNTTAQQPKDSASGETLGTPTGSLRWTWHSPGKEDGETPNDTTETGYLQLNTPASKGVWGTVAARAFKIGDMNLLIDEIQPDYGIVLLSSADGSDTASAKRMVLTVMSHSENLNMGWNPKHNSVGRNWGQSPTSVTSFEAKVMIRSDTPVRCFALDGTGQRKAEIQVKQRGGKAAFAVSPTDRTLWYEISRQ